MFWGFFPENIALKKPAYQQYPYTGPGPANHLMEASNAVDGLKTNLSIWGGQCVLSDNDKQTATWWVNLTSILSIHHVTIYYRTEVYGWGTLSKSVKIRKIIQWDFFLRMNCVLLFCLNAYCTKLLNMNRYIFVSKHAIIAYE